MTGTFQFDLFWANLGRVVYIRIVHTYGGLVGVYTLDFKNIVLLTLKFILNIFILLFFSYGAQSLIVSRFLHHIVSLYSDPTAPVRDAAASTLVEIYRHIGDRVRVDLQKKHSIPPAK